MPEEKKESKTYDLRKMEDLFECVEIVTMARGALYSVDPRLASRLEKVSDALSDFSMNMDVEPFEAAEDIPDSDLEKKSQGRSRPAPTEEFREQDPFDLLSDFPVSDNSRKNSSSKSEKDDDEDEGIIDIITGEKIK